MTEKPKRNCSKFGFTSIGDTGGANPTNCQISFGVTALGKLPWKMRSIEYAGMTAYDTFAPGFNLAWSTDYGTQFVLRPVNLTFLSDMFDGLIDYTFVGNGLRPLPGGALTPFGNVATLRTLGSLVVAPDIDSVARLNYFTCSINNPGWVAALYKPPVLHAFPFFRSQDQATPDHTGYNKTSCEIDIPGGYDFLLSYLVPGGDAQLPLASHMVLAGGLRFTLEQPAAA